MMKWAIMTLKKDGYIPRLIDDELRRYLSVFGAANITGPKWCGKTWAAYNCCNSATLRITPACAGTIT